MNILWLYRYEKSYNFDHWFHMDFAKVISKYPGTTLMAYGPELDKKYPELVVLTYRPDITLEVLHRTYPFDVVIMNTKSRMFFDYNPPLVTKKEEDPAKQWLPNDIRTFGAPVIMLEEDYHYEIGDSWYQNYANLVIHRHYYNYNVCKDRGNVKTVWLPFSVDTNVFKPNDAVPRKRRICFSGSCAEHVYTFRARAKNLLDKASLLANFEQQCKEENYVLCLQNYIAHLSGSSNFYVTPAKMFEIMASGSVLFTNRSDKYGLDKLFPDGSYCTYNEDGSDVVSTANQIINDRQYQSSIVASALHCIREKHTNEIRIGQMLDIIKEEFKL